MVVSFLGVITLKCRSARFLRVLTSVTVFYLRPSAVLRLRVSYIRDQREGGPTLRTHASALNFETDSQLLTWNHTLGSVASLLEEGAKWKGRVERNMEHCN